MGIMSIISMMMLIASYNAYLSYDTTWILDLTRETACRRNQRGGCADGPGAQGLGGLSQRGGAAAWDSNVGRRCTGARDGDAARVGLLAGAADETGESHGWPPPERHRYGTGRGRRVGTAREQSFVLEWSAVADLPHHRFQQRVHHLRSIAGAGAVARCEARCSTSANGDSRPG